jgi:flagellar hook assembly protein FlgD
VRTLADDDLPAGKHAIDWDGADERGDRARSGVYFYRLETSGRTHIGKVLLMP